MDNSERIKSLSKEKKTQHTDSQDSSSIFAHRSRLHNFSTLSWLKKRHNKTANEKYLYLPEELQKQEEIKQIFIKFDDDGSGIE